MASNLLKDLQTLERVADEALAGIAARRASRDRTDKIANARAVVILTAKELVDHQTSNAGVSPAYLNLENAVADLRELENG